MSDLPPPRVDRDVPAYWRALGLPGLVDLHVHFLPERMQQKVWAFFDASDVNYGVPWPVEYRGGEQERLTLLRDLGVLAFPSHPYPHKPGMAAWLNAWSAEFARRTPECLRSATFWPEPAAADYVGTALADGTRMFKAHLQVGGYDPTDPLLDDVWGQLAAAGVPVTVHCGSGPQPGRFTGPGPMRAVLARHPDLTLVVAHLGMPEYHEFLDLTAAYDRVHLDTTMFGTDIVQRFAPTPPDLPSRLLELGTRIVLGSDFPTIPHSYAHQLAALHALDLGPEWLRAVLYGNGARLVGLT